MRLESFKLSSVKKCVSCTEKDRATAVAKFAEFWAANKDGECWSQFLGLRMPHSPPSVSHSSHSSCDRLVSQRADTTGTILVALLLSVFSRVVSCLTALRSEIATIAIQKPARIRNSKSASRNWPLRIRSHYEKKPGWGERRGGNRASEARSHSPVSESAVSRFPLGFVSGFRLFSQR